MLLPERSPLRRLRRQDDGMSTVEYAVGTIAAAAFAAVLYVVLTGNSVVGALTALIEHAIAVKP
jgi:Flp pilus assembly pilin Flp